MWRDRGVSLGRDNGCLPWAVRRIANASGARCRRRRAAVPGMRSRLRERFRRWMPWLLGPALLLAFSAAAEPGPRHPDVVKAAFLYRFTSFVEWPPPDSGRDAFTIAVLGADAVADQLARLLPKYRVQGLPARVRRIAQAGELGDAQMLYVGPYYRGDLEPVLNDVRGRPVLVVTDHDGALAVGSTVNFVMVERRVRFEISLDAAHAAGLKVDAGLLAMAVRVLGGQRSGRSERWPLRVACR